MDFCEFFFTFTNRKKIAKMKFYLDRFWNFALISLTVNIKEQKKIIKSIDLLIT